LCQRYLHWDDSRFKAECARYQALWQHAYAPPDRQLAENPAPGI